jgi:hypothetical protein
VFVRDPKSSNNGTCDEVVDLIGARCATAEELDESVVDGPKVKALTTANVKLTGRAVFQHQQVRAWSRCESPRGHHVERARCAPGRL